MREIYYIVMISRRLAVVRVAAIACTKISAKGTVRGRSGDSATMHHITELGTTAEQSYITVLDDRVNVTMDRFGSIDTSTIKFFNISMINDPGDITFTIRSTDTFHTGTRHLSEAATTDITLGIIIVNKGLRLIIACKVELSEITASDRHGRMWRTFARIILMGASVELLEPYIASNMEITYTISGIVLLGNPLFNNTSLQDIGTLCPAFAVFKLSNAEKGGVSHLEPSLRLHDTKVIGTGTAGGLLCHTETYQVQEIVSYGMES